MFKYRIDGEIALLRWSYLSGDLAKFSKKTWLAAKLLGI